MTYRDPHTQLTISTPVLDLSALTTLAEDLSTPIAVEYLTALTALLETRITRIEHTLTHHNLQTTHNAQDTEDIGTSVEAVNTEAVEALLSLRAGAVMVGARRLQLTTTQALTEVRGGNIAIHHLIVQLRQEARQFTVAATRVQHPSTRFAA